MRLLMLVILVASGLLFANSDYSFKMQTDGTDSLDVLVQKNKMDRFFGGMIDWDDGDLYLFIDKNDILRLFVYFGGDSIALYQIPAPRIHRWLNPSGYTKEMQSREMTIQKDLCRQVLGVDSALVSEIKSLKIESYPMVYVDEKEKPLKYPKYDKAYYSGFVRRDYSPIYFRVVDFRQLGMEFRYPLNKFVNLFEKLEHDPFSKELDGCK